MRYDEIPFAITILIAIDKRGTDGLIVESCCLSLKAKSSAESGSGANPTESTLIGPGGKEKYYLYCYVIRVQYLRLSVQFPVVNGRRKPLLTVQAA